MDIWGILGNALIGVGQGILFMFLFMMFYRIRLLRLCMNALTYEWQTVTEIHSKVAKQTVVPITQFEVFTALSRLAQNTKNVEGIWHIAYKDYGAFSIKIFLPSSKFRKIKPGIRRRPRIWWKLPSPFMRPSPT